MVTFYQYTINALVAALQQAAVAAASLFPGGAAPIPSQISKKSVIDPYKTGINTGTSDGGNIY